MSKNIEEVLKEATNVPTSCTVIMDGEGLTSEDFVAVLSRENGDASIFYNTDALTLGMAMKMIAKSFVESMGELPEDEREQVQGILSGADIQDKPEEGTE